MTSWRVPGQRRVASWITSYAYRRARLQWHLSTGVYVEVANHIEWRIYTDIFADGDYDLPLSRLFSRNVDRPLTVADLGANVGFFALRLAHLASVRSIAKQINVEGFEASSSLCALARQRWSACRLERCKVRFNVTRGLVGKRTGSAEFFRQYHHGNNSLFRKSRDSEVVAYLDLAAHFAGVDCIDLLKCDIEGAEQMFFEAYPDLLQKTHAVVVELHSTLCDSARCTSLLRDAGFTGHRVIEKNPTDSLEYFWKDAATTH